MRVNNGFIFIVIFLCSAFAKAQSSRSQCYFVTAENGLNLRKGMGVDYESIGKLPYGAQVLVTKKQDSDAQEFVLDNGVRSDGTWVQVIPTFLNMNYSREKMYVFDAYLSKHLTKIPEQSLHNFTELVELHAHDDVESVLGVSSRREMYRTGRYCDVRYEYNPAAAIALKDVIQFEVVEKDDYIKSKVLGDFQIDTRWQPTKFKLEHNYRPVEWEQYYLPLNKGKDSILIKDHTGEWASKTEYYGQIDALDSYLISGFAEDAEVMMVNRTTGNISFLSNGIPEISPQGAYMVNEYFNVFSNETQFTVRQFNVETLPKDYFISFTSWLSAGEFFWISENEFIMGVLPMDTVFQQGNASSQVVITYLKGTIKF
jgi:hypothetical protein